MRNRGRSLGISIGAIPVHISSDSQELIAQVRERYANFLSQGVAHCALSIKVNVLPDDAVIFLSEAEDRPEVKSHQARHRWSIAWHGFRGELDLETRMGEVECTLSPAGLNSFLRFVYSLILPSEDGLLVHASSLIRNGKAYVFAGESGVGKTTIARLSDEATVLSDDISLIRISVERFPIAHGTPFWGELAVGGENLFAPLAGLYFPVQAKENRIIALKPRQVLERLMPNVVFFANDEALSRRVFEICSDLVTMIPGYELHFTPDPDFWRCINAGQVCDQE